MFFILCAHLLYVHYVAPTLELPTIFVYKKYLIFWAMFGAILSAMSVALPVGGAIKNGLYCNILTALGIYEFALGAFIGGLYLGWTVLQIFGVLLFLFTTGRIATFVYREYRTHARPAD